MVKDNPGNHLEDHPVPNQPDPAQDMAPEANGNTLVNLDERMDQEADEEISQLEEMIKKGKHRKKIVAKLRKMNVQMMTCLCGKRMKKQSFLRHACVTGKLTLKDIGPLYFLKPGANGIQPKKVCRYCGAMGRLTEKPHSKCHLRFKPIEEQILRTRDPRQIIQGITALQKKGPFHEMLEEFDMTCDIASLFKSIILVAFQNNAYLKTVIPREYFAIKEMQNEQPQMVMPNQKNSRVLEIQDEDFAAIEDMMNGFSEDKDIANKRVGVTLLKKALEVGTRKIKKLFVSQLQGWNMENLGKLHARLRYCDSHRPNFGKAIRSMGTTEPTTYIPNPRVIHEIKEKGLGKFPELIQSLVKIFVENPNGMTEEQIHESLGKQADIQLPAGIIGQVQEQLLIVTEQVQRRFDLIEMTYWNMEEFIKNTIATKTYRLKMSKKLKEKLTKMVMAWRVRGQQMEQILADLKMNRQNSWIDQNEIMGFINYLMITEKQKNVQPMRAPQQIMARQVPQPFRDMVHLLDLQKQYTAASIFRTSFIKDRRFLLSNLKNLSGLSKKYNELFIPIEQETKKQLAQQVFIFIDSALTQSFFVTKSVINLLAYIQANYGGVLTEEGINSMNIPQICPPTICQDAIPFYTFADTQLRKRYSSKINMCTTLGEILRIGIQEQLVKKQGDKYIINQNELKLALRNANGWNFPMRTVYIQKDIIRPLHYKQDMTQGVLYKPKAILSIHGVVEHFSQRVSWEIGKKNITAQFDDQKYICDQKIWTFMAIIYAHGKRMSVEAACLFMGELADKQFENRVINYAAGRPEDFKVQTYPHVCMIEIIDTQTCMLEKKNGEVAKVNDPPYRQFRNFQTQCGQCCQYECKCTRNRQIAKMSVQPQPKFVNKKTPTIKLGLKLLFSEQNNNCKDFITQKGFTYKIQNTWMGESSLYQIHSKFPTICQEDTKKLIQAFENSSKLPIKIKASKQLMAKGKLDQMINGIFATENLQKDTFICFYTGQVYLQRQCPHDKLFSKVELGWLYDQMLSICPTQMFNEGRYMNSSDIKKFNNCKINKVLVNLGRGDEVILFLTATKKIQKGEQLFWFYGEHFEFPAFEQDCFLEITEKPLPKSEFQEDVGQSVLQKLSMQERNIEEMNMLLPNEFAEFRPTIETQKRGNIVQYEHLVIQQAQKSMYGRKPSKQHSKILTHILTLPPKNEDNAMIPEDNEMIPEELAQQNSLQQNPTPHISIPYPQNEMTPEDPNPVGKNSTPK